MKPTGEVPVANIVPTADEVAQMLLDKPDCWQWAAFGSVLFQRLAEVETRRVQQFLELRARTGARLPTDDDVAAFLRTRLRVNDDIGRELDAFMRAASFMGAFGDPDVDGSADAAGIVRNAHRLMDFHDRYLDIAEDCQTCVVPGRHLALVADCAQFLNAPLRDISDFVNDVLVGVEDLRQRVIAGQRDIELDPILLQTTTDDELVWSILDRIAALE